MELDGENIIKQSAYLRGKYQFNEAMELIEKNIDDIHSDIKTNAWIEAFQAAVEVGNDELAKRYAREIAKAEPNLPGIQVYL